MLSVVLAMLALQAAPAAPNIQEPSWIRPPVLENGRTSRGARPLPAGEVALTCAVNVEGRLENCQIESDTSVARRLSAPALRAAREARMNPRMVDGQPAPGEVKIKLTSLASAPERN